MQLTLTREQLEAARAKLAKQGIALVGDKAQVSHDGVTANITYNEPVLDIEVVKHPFWEPVSLIESAIGKWFNQ